MLLSQIPVFVAVMALLAQCGGDETNVSATPSEVDFISRDISTIRDSGALGLIEVYDLFSIEENTVALYANNDPNEEWVRMWNSNIEIAYDGGGKNGWQLSTSSDFQACIFQTSSIWYAQANGLSADRLCDLLREEVKSAKPEVSTSMTGSNIIQWRAQGVFIGIISKEDFLNSDTPIAFTLQFSRAPAADRIEKPTRQQQ